MDNKEIADRLREIAELLRNSPLAHGNPYLTTEVNKLADEIDPPYPEPGTVVWWREKVYYEAYIIGIVDADCKGVIDEDQKLYVWADIEYKPARILAPGEVAVTIPPVSEWPKTATAIEGAYHNHDGVIKWYDALYITRTEAERLENER